MQTLEIHSLVVRSDIQVRNGKGIMSKTSILHLPRFAPKLAPGLQFAVGFSAFVCLDLNLAYTGYQSTCRLHIVSAQAE